MQRKYLIIALNDALIETTDKAFAESQIVVPVRTGRLKGSGKAFCEDKSCVINYSASYADVVEHGWKGGIVNVHSYRRRDGIFVREHTMNQPPREGRHYIENSVRICFKGIPGTMSPFLNSFINNLRRYYKEVKIN